MEGIIALAFAGLFAMFLLSLNFSFLLAIKLYQTNKKLETFEEQMLKIAEEDRIIVEEIREILRAMGQETPDLE